MRKLLCVLLSLTMVFSGIVWSFGEDTETVPGNDIVAATTEAPVVEEAEEVTTEAPVVEEPEEVTTEAPVTEEKPFENGYARVDGGTKVYAANNEQEEIGTITQSSIVYAVNEFTLEDLSYGWVRIIVETSEIKEQDGSFIEGYVRGVNVTVLTEEEADALTEQLAKDDTVRSYQGTLMPAAAFEAAVKAEEPAEEPEAEPETEEAAVEPEVVEPGEEPEAVEPAEEPEAVEPVEEPEAVEPVEEPEVIEPAEEPEAVEPAEEPEAVEPVEEPEVIEPAEEPEAVEPVEEPEAVEPVEEPEVIEPAEEPEAEEPAAEPETEEKPAEDPKTEVVPVVEKPAYSVTASAADTDYTFTDIDSSTCKVTGYKGTQTTLSIPKKTSAGKTVTVIAANAFKGKNITSVKIPSSVTTIEASAFANCTALTEIVIPDSVTTIGESAFLGCSKLAKAYVSMKVTQVPADCFRDCPLLATVSLSDDVTVIGARAFKNCSALSEITASSGDNQTDDPAGGLVGDADGDGTAYTLQDIMTMIDGYCEMEPSPFILENCDTDKDGEYCTMQDIMTAIDVYCGM